MHSTMLWEVDRELACLHHFLINILVIRKRFYQSINQIRSDLIIIIQTFRELCQFCEYAWCVVGMSSESGNSG